MTTKRKGGRPRSGSLARRGDVWYAVLTVSTGKRKWIRLRADTPSEANREFLSLVDPSTGFNGAKVPARIKGIAVDIPGLRQGLSRSLSSVDTFVASGDSSLTYFIQSDCGRIKIGSSSETALAGRLISLRANSPRELQLIAYIHGGGIEGMLHQIFWWARVHGEWFDPAPELVELTLIAKAAVNPSDATKAILGRLLKYDLDELCHASEIAA